MARVYAWLADEVPVLPEVRSITPAASTLTNEWLQEVKLLISTTQRAPRQIFLIVENNVWLTDI
jgi:hypothetical protein